MNRRECLTWLAVSGSALVSPVFAAEKADPEAVALLRSAYEKRYAWDSHFPGFEGKLLVQYLGTEYHGTARVTGKYDAAVSLEDAKAADWAKDELLSIILHRRYVPFDSSDGRYPLTLGPADHHPSGRLIRLNDGMNSTYRVRDGQIMQVNRSAGPQMRFTIDIVENIHTDDGRFLPRVFSVSYFKNDGSLVSAETYRDGYRKVGGYYLPEYRRQIVAKNGATDSTLLQIEDLRLAG